MSLEKLKTNFLSICKLVNLISSDILFTLKFSGTGEGGTYTAL